MPRAPGRSHDVIVPHASAVAAGRSERAVGCPLVAEKALVTGGASGIGLAAVELLARAGAVVALNHLADDPRGPQQVERAAVVGPRDLLADGEGLAGAVEDAGHDSGGPLAGGASAAFSSGGRATKGAHCGGEMNGGLASNSKRTVERTGSAPDRSTTVLDVSASQGARSRAWPSGLQVISPDRAASASSSRRLPEELAMTIELLLEQLRQRRPQRILGPGRNLADQTGVVGRSSMPAN